MKVKIGPYTHFWNTVNVENAYLEFMHKQHHFDIKESEYTRMDRAVIWFLDLWQLVLNCTVNKIFQKRKEYVRIDRWDTFSADDTLAIIILPLLKQFKQDNYAAPNVDDEDVPESLRSTNDPDFKKESYDVDKYHFERWDWVIDEMIYAFERLNDPFWEEEFTSGEVDMISVPTNAHGDEVPKEEAELWRWEPGPNDTYEIDHEAINEVNERINNGLRLFGKYFRSLWT